MVNVAAVIRSLVKSSLLAGTVALAAPAFGQTSAAPPERISLSGPRFGLTVLSTQSLEKLAEDDIHVKSTISQFGWQFERQI